MIRAGTREVPVARTTSSPGPSLLVIAAALGLLLTALAGPFGRASEPAPTVAPHAATASLADLIPGPVAAPPAPGYPMQAGTWWWWIPADQLPAVVLLASMLLGVAGFIAAAARSQAPPSSRGPPSIPSSR